ncbi:MAG TPA: WcaF family extracellular polysaccharide biosynthesis acetyltransferase [Pyrinomonadaceae bacterium]|nr:WcaF family extracellular polysaccharide biosynthesis acetyltransferase [Pyrinomonadaceae bacterium]
MRTSKAVEGVEDADAGLPPRAGAGRGRVDLSAYSAAWYRPGGLARRLLWYAVNFFFFNTQVPYPSSFKRALLNLFGASVGRGVVIKPCVNIKYPWLLEVGDHAWLGEGAWIDNLARVKLGASVCVSQGAYIFTGNHDYKKRTFDLIVRPVVIEDGAWVGARAVVCPGVRMGSHSVLTVGSVARKDTEPFVIYCGNPAAPVRRRVLEDTP